MFQIRKFVYCKLPPPALCLQGGGERAGLAQTPLPRARHWLICELTVLFSTADTPVEPLQPEPETEETEVVHLNKENTRDNLQNRGREHLWQPFTPIVLHGEHTRQSAEQR